MTAQTAELRSTDMLETFEALNGPRKARILDAAGLVVYRCAKLSHCAAVLQATQTTPIQKAIAIELADASANIAEVVATMAIALGVDQDSLWAVAEALSKDVKDALAQAAQGK